MKKFLVVLLSLGLLVAFGTTASAADVKFAGSYYLVGVYENAPQVVDPNNYSRAAFYQRVRLQPTFQIAEGLTFTARMDALEKQWGQIDWKGGADQTSSRRVNQSTGNPKIQENIEFERAWVTFMTKIGAFQVGYQSADAWGTTFGDSEGVRPRIAYATKAGPVTFAAVYEKFVENDTANNAVTGLVDADYDAYMLTGVYKAKAIEAGLLYKYYVNKTNRVAGPFSSKTSLLTPYMKGTFGPVFVEAEVSYYFGKAREYENGTADIDLSAWSAYLNGKVNLGPAAVGALIGYASGDNGSDPTKAKTAPGGGGTSWNPAMILMNDDLATWLPGGVSTGNSGKTNMILYQLYASFKPLAKLTLDAALTYAEADKLTAAEEAAGKNKKKGTEFDVSATYSIYDNLTYMVGAGYLWTGDNFKTAVNATTNNDYLLVNKLTLSF